MNNVRVIPSPEGMIVVFNKHALRQMKDGGSVDVMLANGDRKMRMMFMRDTTHATLLKKQQKQLEPAQPETKE